MSRLNEIEARTNAATEGPWEWEGDAKAEWEIGANSLVPSRRPDDPVLYGYGYDESGIEVSNDADAQFIAHARTDVPALVGALRAVLDLHKPGLTFYGHGFSQPLCTCGATMPCPTVETIHKHLGDDL